MGIFIKELSKDGMPYQEYLQYLESVKDSLPLAAYEYGKAEWHYDLSDPRSIHDAWLRTLTINEVSNERPERYQIEISFLGAFHDRLFKFAYTGVTQYQLLTPSTAEAHGDVYFDEIRLSNKRNVIHEVLFMTNVRWIIECKSFLFEEEMLPHSRSR
jgi:hypothetical protein